MSKTKGQVVEVKGVKDLSLEELGEQRVDVKNLVGFRDLVAERFGYWLGRRLKQQELSTLTKDQRKTVSEVRKSIDIPTFIKKADLEGYSAKLKELDEAKEVVKKMGEPLRKDMVPLAKAVKIIDNVLIPDSFKELGVALVPRFSLSAYMQAQVAQTKK